MSQRANIQELLVQWATLIAVIVGVLLVVWELRQTRDMTLTQLAHGTIGDIQAERAAQYGDNLGDVLATACFEPERLTSAQAVILDAYFSNQITLVNRYRVSMEVGGFNTNWRTLGRPVIERVLAYPQGRTWLEDHPLWSGESVSEELAGFFDTVASEVTYSCSDHLDRLLRGSPDDA